MPESGVNAEIRELNQTDARDAVCRLRPGDYPKLGKDRLGIDHVREQGRVRGDEFASQRRSSSIARPFGIAGFTSIYSEPRDKGAGDRSARRAVAPQAYFTQEDCILV